MYQTKEKQIWPFMSFSLKFPIQSVYFWRHSHSTSLKVWGIVGGGNKLVKLLQISVKSQIVGSQGSKDVRSDWSDTPRIGVRLQISISSRWRVWAEITPKHENRSKGLISPSCSKILALGNATPKHLGSNWFNLLGCCKIFTWDVFSVVQVAAKSEFKRGVLSCWWSWWWGWSWWDMACTHRIELPMYLVH